MKKVGILGGTFDPIHKGHLNIANHAMQACMLNEVWFIPCHQNPLKPVKPIATNQQRIDMIELAIKDTAQFKCDSREITREGSSYTIDTLRELKQEQPETDFYFIMSTDAYKQLDQWKESDELTDYATLIITQRPGDDKIKLSTETHKKILQLQTEVTIHTSSTDIRESLQNNTLTNPLIPSAVRDYIQQYHLYHV